MFSALSVALPVAMLLPVPADDASRQLPAVSDAFGQPLLLQQPVEDDSTKARPVSEQAAGRELWAPLSDQFRTDPQFQVRVQGRIIIRVSPRRPSRTSLVADTRTTKSAPPQYEEKKIGKCLNAKSIAGMQPNGDRLILFMRNRTLVRARLNKKCNAKDFYAGFYVERHKDGRLCIKRDELQSRAGSRCKLRSFRQLVPK